MARGGDVFVLDMGRPVKIMELAKSMIRLHGLTPYLTNENSEPEGETGDIQIQITGLSYGEKLHEELLIAGNPQGTEHPRILTASEIAMAPAALERLLDDLWTACKAFDLAAVQTLLLKAPLEYRPDSCEIHDMMWEAALQQPQTTRLRLVGVKP